jgi:hypothetical protein
LDLAPTVSNLGSISSGWIRVSPAMSGQSFLSPRVKENQMQTASVIAVVRTTSTGAFVSINPFDRMNQAFELSFEGGSAIGRFRSSPSEGYETALTLPANDAVVVAVSFGSETSQLDLSVDGKLNTLPTAVGTAVEPFKVGRFISLGSPVAGQSADLKDFYFFDRQLSRSELGAMIQYVAQQNGLLGQIKLDPLLGGGTGGPATDPNFAPVQALIESKCVSCHNWHNAKASTYLSLGLVVKGNAGSSKLYYRLTGSDSGPGPKNMPQSGSISATDVAKFKTWIEGMP